MIKYIVMWALKGEAAGFGRLENVICVKRWLEECREVILGILTFEVVVPHLGLEATCDIMLYAEFNSRQALAAYNIHPSTSSLMSVRRH
jgi:hypothetical protein